MEHRPISRAEERTAAGINAFDGFRGKHGGKGLDIQGRRRAIDNMSRNAGGTDGDNGWNIPSQQAYDQMRAERAAAAGAEPDHGTPDGTSRYSRWRGRVVGSFGALRDRIKDSSDRPVRDTTRSTDGSPPDPDAWSVPPGNRPNRPPAPSPAAREPSPPPEAPTPAPEPAPPPESSPAPTQTESPAAFPPTAEDATATDPWEIPDLEKFAQIRARRSDPTTAPSSSTNEMSKTSETGSWRAHLPERIANARRKIGEALAGMRDAAGAIINTARGRVDAAKEWVEKQSKTPLGKVLHKAGEQIIKDIAEGKKRSKNGYTLQTAKFLAFYGGYKAQEVWEKKKWDIATGAATGAVVRPLLLMIGVETYLASAGIAFTTGAVRKGISELDNYITPETDGARKNLTEKIKSLNRSQRKEIAMKMLVAGSISGVSSFAGAGLMQWTGLDVMIKDVAHSGMNKIGGAFAGLKENLPQLPDLAKADTTNVGESIIDRPSTPKLTIETDTGSVVERPGLPRTPGGTDSTLIIDRPGTPPGNSEIMTPINPDSTTGTRPPMGPLPPNIAEGPPYGADAEVGISQGTPPPKVPVTTAVGPPYGAETDVGVRQGISVAPVVETPPINPVEAVIDNLTDKKLPPGSTPWAIAEQLLKEANPNGRYTPADIMAVDKALILAQVDPNTGKPLIAVPEWGMEGKILHTKLPSGMNFNITEDVKKVIKQTTIK